MILPYKPKEVLAFTKLGDSGIIRDCELKLGIPRIFLRIPKNLFLGILKNS